LEGVLIFPQQAVKGLKESDVQTRPATQARSLSSLLKRKKAMIAHRLFYSGSYLIVLNLKRAFGH
jgi:hypothetical protein